MKESFSTIVKVVLFVLFVALVVIGQQTVGKVYLFAQLVGIVGILVLLWNYNRKYT